MAIQFSAPSEIIRSKIDVSLQGSVLNGGRNATATPQPSSGDLVVPVYHLTMNELAQGRLKLSKPETWIAQSEDEPDQFVEFDGSSGEEIGIHLRSLFPKIRAALSKGEKNNAHGEKLRAGLLIAESLYLSALWVGQSEDKFSATDTFCILEGFPPFKPGKRLDLAEFGARAKLAAGLYPKRE